LLLLLRVHTRLLEARVARERGMFEDEEGRGERGVGGLGSV
jgi:hypothetical protein